MDAYIYAGLRSPFGRHSGCLASVRPDDLLAGVIRNLLTESALPPASIEDVIIGCTNQAGEDCRNVARNAALLAGVPVEAGGQTVNRLCASGLAAVVSAAHAIQSGEGELFIAGGVESMTRAPFAMAKADKAFSKDARIYDTSLGARFPNTRFEELFGADPMAQTADNVGAALDIGRPASDAYALRSQQRYEAARAAGFFAEEITPVVIPAGRRSPEITVTVDEHPRPDSSAESLAKLKSIYQEGVVTAGNASGINDGAAALFVGNSRVGEQSGMAPLARIVATAVAGVEPRVMGIGPALAIPRALQRAGLTLGQMDVIEINEAFATQVLGCLKMLELADDDSRVNPNGGAIAVGHPLGASGARLALTATRQLAASGDRYAVVSLCIGVGQGLAVILERV